MVKLIALLFLCCVTVTFSADVLECNKSRTKHSRANDILISSCTDGEKLCRLKKRSDVKLELKFTPKEDIAKMTNRVYAILLGIPFPFVGVDGTSACEKMFKADGSKASCPLKANEEYVYKDSFKILDIYPKLRLDVHWALVYDNKTALCFEIPAKITS